jgi:hypothetical protein
VRRHAARRRLALRRRKHPARHAPSRLWLRVHADHRLEQRITQGLKLEEMVRVRRHGADHEVCVRLEAWFQASSRCQEGSCGDPHPSPLPEGEGEEARGFVKRRVQLGGRMYAMLSTASRGKITCSPRQTGDGVPPVAPPGVAGPLAVRSPERGHGSRQCSAV